METKHVQLVQLLQKCACVIGVPELEEELPKNSKDLRQSQISKAQQVVELCMEEEESVFRALDAVYDATLKSSKGFSHLMRQFTGLEVDKKRKNGREDDLERKFRKVSFSPEATNCMKQWLFANMESPYPSPSQKTLLIKQTGLTLAQINQWFTNARRRMLPLLKEYLSLSNQKISQEISPFEDLLSDLGDLGRSREFIGILRESSERAPEVEIKKELLSPMDLAFDSDDEFISLPGSGEIQLVPEECYGEDFSYSPEMLAWALGDPLKQLSTSYDRELFQGME